MDQLAADFAKYLESKIPWQLRALDKLVGAKQLQQGISQTVMACSRRCDHVPALPTQCIQSFLVSCLHVCG